MLLRFIQSITCLVFVTCLTACGEPQGAIELFENGAYSKALVKFQDLAAKGDANAINYLGIHYYIGAGVGRDLTRAAAQFEQAALLGHPAAQKNLGVMYYRGLGVEQDFHQAYGWMHHARAGGNSEAQNYIDLMHYNVTPNAMAMAVDRIHNQIEQQKKLLSPLNEG